MLNLQNKTSTKIISLVLMQSFLFTGVIYPESISNPNTSSLYIEDNTLRVPIDSANGYKRMQDALNSGVQDGSFLKPDKGWKSMPEYARYLYNVRNKIGELRSGIAGVKVYYYAIGGGFSSLGSGVEDIDIVSPLIATDFTELIGADITRGDYKIFKKKIAKDLSSLGIGSERISFPEEPGVENIGGISYPVFTANFSYLGKARKVKIYYNLDATKVYPDELKKGYNVLYSRGNSWIIKNMTSPTKSGLINNLSKNNSFIIMENSPNADLSFEGFGAVSLGDVSWAGGRRLDFYTNISGKKTWSRRGFVKTLALGAAAALASKITYKSGEPSYEEKQANASLGERMHYERYVSEKQFEKEKKDFVAAITSRKNILGPEDSVRVNRFLNPERIQVIQLAAKEWQLDPALIAGFLYEENTHTNSLNKTKESIKEFLSRMMGFHDMQNTVGLGQVSASFMRSREFLDFLYDKRDLIMKQFIKTKADKGLFKEFIDGYEFMGDIPDDGGAWKGWLRTLYPALNSLADNVEPINILLAAYAMRVKAREISIRNKNVTGIPDISIMDKNSSSWVVRQYQEIPEDLQARYLGAFNSSYYPPYAYQYFLAADYTGVRSLTERAIAKVRAYIMFSKSAAFTLSQAADVQYVAPSLKNQQAAERGLDDIKLIAAGGIAALSLESVIDRIDKIIDMFNPKMTFNEVYKLTEELSEIVKSSPEVVGYVTARLLRSRLFDSYPQFINNTISKIVEDSPDVIVQVLEVIMEKIASENDPKRLLNLREVLYLDGIFEHDLEVLNYVQRLERAYKIINGIKKMTKDEDLKNLKPLLMEKISIMMGFKSTSQGPKIIALHVLFKEGSLNDDELEAMMLHEVMHAERGDDKRWLELVEMEDREEATKKVRDIEFEVDRLVAERLLEHGKDPRVYIELLKKSDAIDTERDLVIPSSSSKGIPTPPIEERVKRLEKFLNDNKTASHFSLRSKDNRLTSEAGLSTTERFKVGEQEYDINDAGIMNKIEINTNKLETIKPESGLNITFTIRGPTARAGFADYLRTNPSILQEALSRSESLHNGTLSQDITVLLADKYDYLAGDHKANNLIILNASDLEDMLNKNSDPIFISELVTSLLSEELAHERGADSTPDTEANLALEAGYNTKTALKSIPDSRSLSEYIEFIEGFGVSLEGEPGYLNYLKVLNRYQDLSWTARHSPLVKDRTAVIWQMEMGLSKALLENLYKKLISEHGYSKQAAELEVGELAKLTMAGGLGNIKRDLTESWAEKGTDLVSINILYGKWIKGMGYIEKDSVNHLIETMGPPEKEFEIEIFDRNDVWQKIKTKVSIYRDPFSPFPNYWIYCPEIFDGAYPDGKEHLAQQILLYRKAGLKLLEELRDSGKIKDKLLFSLSEVYTALCVPDAINDEFKDNPVLKDVYKHHYNHTVVPAGMPRLPAALSYFMGFNTNKYGSSVIEDGQIVLAKIIGLEADMITGCSMLHTDILRTKVMANFKYKIPDNISEENSEGAYLDNWQGEYIQKVIAKHYVALGAKDDAELFNILDSAPDLQSAFISDLEGAVKKQKNQSIAWFNKEGVNLSEDSALISLTRRIVSYKRLDIVVEMLRNDENREKFQKLGISIIVGGRRFDVGDQGFGNTQIRTLEKLLEKYPELKNHVAIVLDDSNHAGYNIFIAPKIYNAVDATIMLSDKDQEAGPTSPTKGLVNAGGMIATLDGIIPEVLVPFNRETMEGNGFKVDYSEEGAPSVESLFKALEDFNAVYKDEELHKSLMYNSLKTGMLQSNISTRQGPGLIKLWQQGLEIKENALQELLSSSLTVQQSI